MKRITEYTGEKPIEFYTAILYTVDGKTLEKHYTSPKRAVAAAEKHVAVIGRPGYWAQVRRETVYRRTTDCEISSSGPYWFNDRGYYHYDGHGTSAYYNGIPA